MKPKKIWIAGTSIDELEFLTTNDIGREQALKLYWKHLVNHAYVKESLQEFIDRVTLQNIVDVWSFTLSR